MLFYTGTVKKRCNNFFDGLTKAIFRIFPITLQCYIWIEIKIAVWDVIAHDLDDNPPSSTYVPMLIGKENVAENNLVASRVYPACHNVEPVVFCYYSPSATNPVKRLEIGLLSSHSHLCHLLHGLAESHHFETHTVHQGLGGDGTHLFGHNVSKLTTTYPDYLFVVQQLSLVFDTQVIHDLVYLFI